MEDSDLMTSSSAGTVAAQRPVAPRELPRGPVGDSDLSARSTVRAAVFMGHDIGNSTCGGNPFRDGSEGEPAAQINTGESGGETEGGSASLFAEVGHNGQTESGGEESDAEANAEVPEVGQALGESEANAEFLPFLAAALPKIISVGVPLLQSIFRKVGPVVQQAINRAPSHPGSATPAWPPRNVNAVLQQIMQLLQTVRDRESGQESDLPEAEEQFAAEVAAAMGVLIGNDDRVHISNTTAEPWRSIAALRITFPSGVVYRGTGFFIAPRVLATAGHCVFLRNQGGWARSVEVIPAMNGSTRLCGTARSSNLRSVAGWTEQGRPEAAIGCIVLPPGALTGNRGSFGFAAPTAARLKAQPAVLAGYPGDKPFAQLWGMARVIETVTDRTLIYDIDTRAAQSGSPVYIKRSNGKRCVVGIHNCGAQSGNSATRVTAPVHEVLTRWAAL